MLKSFLSICILASVASAANFRRVTCPDGSTTSNANCCKYHALRDDLQKNLFGGVCGEEVHESLRLAFHDAIGFSSAQGPSVGGGADGSIMTFSSIETGFGANAGTIDAVNFLSPFLAPHNVSTGDLIQFAAAVGITNCAGAPRLQFLGGRPPPTVASIDGRVPKPEDPLDQIFARMLDGGGFSPTEVAWLLISHTIGRSDHIIPGLVAVPFDTTPFTFDAQFFVEIQLKGVNDNPFVDGTANQTGESVSPLASGSGQNPGELRLLSDHALARDNRTACTFQSFVTNQKLMMESFYLAMKKMAVVGQDVSKLIDCSDAVPVSVPPVKKPSTFPAGKSIHDIVQVCSTPFPTLATDPGPPTVIPHCPPSQGGATGDCDNDEGSL